MSQNNMTPHDELMALAGKATPGEWVLVRVELLEQVYGMARDGCESPTAAYRWCERIDEVFHAGEALADYAEHALELPAAMLDAALAASDDKEE